jgi:hypothetical protein
MLHRIREYFDFYKKQIIFGVIIFLTASLSFGAGYMVNRGSNHAPILIEECSAVSRLQGK